MAVTKIGIQVFPEGHAAQGPIVAPPITDTERGNFLLFEVRLVKGVTVEWVELEFNNLGLLHLDGPGYGRMRRKNVNPGSGRLDFRGRAITPATPDVWDDKYTVRLSTGEELDPIIIICG